MQPKLRDSRLYWRGNKIWCRVLDASGRIKRKPTRCISEVAAVAVANDLERRAADPSYAAAAATSLEGAVVAYIADLRRRKRAAATLKIAAEKSGHFLRIWGRELPLVHLSNGQLVLKYIDQRQREGVIDFTIKKELGHLSQALRIAKHAGTFPFDVDAVFPPFFVGKHKPRSRFATPLELQALVEHLRPRRAAHVLYIVATGARRAESFRARRADTDWTTRVVHLHGTKTEAADDDVPITSISEPILRRALELAPGEVVLFDRWIHMNRDLAWACVRAGIEKLTPNDLRRTLGKWHKLAGVDNANVSKMLRHTTDKLTQTTYAKVSGAEVGVLVQGQLSAAKASVPNLYPGTGEKAANIELPDDETAENVAPPGRVELPANGLGNRFQNPHGVGTKQGVRRAKAQRGVSNSYARRSFPLDEATANLLEARLQAIGDMPRAAAFVAPLGAEQREAIRAAVASGFTHARAAAAFGVNNKTVARIVTPGSRR